MLSLGREQGTSELILDIILSAIIGSFYFSNFVLLLLQDLEQVKQGLVSLLNAGVQEQRIWEEETVIELGNEVKCSDVVLGLNE